VNNLLTLLVALLGALPATAALSAPENARPAAADTTAALPDSSSGPLRFHPVSPSAPDSFTFSATAHPPRKGKRLEGDEGEWLWTPIGDHLVTDPDEWRARHRGHQDLSALVDYNRVDRLRLGAKWEFQGDDALDPRLGVRLERSLGRTRTLYGAQLEQPLLRPGRLALGVSMVRRTEHPDLQQMDDIENSLALLTVRQDFRDYFEREGWGTYLAWRVPDFSTLSVHARSDRYRSLPLDDGTRSWGHPSRPLRDNPAIDDGTANTVSVRSERLLRPTRAMRAGLYHWVEVEHAGGRLHGDFDFTRALADVRSVVRLSPATSLLLRGVGGTTLDGRLPLQKQFTLGSVDGLRAHPIDAFRGDRLFLAQAEYVLGLWRLTGAPFEGGLHVMAFVDAGKAWTGPDRVYDLSRQQLACDGGFGIGTTDDDVRIYFARDLQRPDSPFVISLRLQRPF
jgi:hypothetical protein